MLPGAAESDLRSRPVPRGGTRWTSGVDGGEHDAPAARGPSVRASRDSVVMRCASDRADAARRGRKARAVPRRELAHLDDSGRKNASGAARQLRHALAVAADHRRGWAAGRRPAAAATRAGEISSDRARRLPSAGDVERDQRRRPGCKPAWRQTGHGAFIAVTPSARATEWPRNGLEQPDVSCSGGVRVAPLTQPKEVPLGHLPSAARTSSTSAVAQAGRSCASAKRPMMQVHLARAAMPGDGRANSRRRTVEPLALDRVVAAHTGCLRKHEKPGRDARAERDIASRNGGVAIVERLVCTPPAAARHPRSGRCVRPCSIRCSPRYTVLPGIGPKLAQPVQAAARPRPNRA